MCFLDLECLTGKLCYARLKVFSLVIFSFYSAACSSPTGLEADPIDTTAEGDVTLKRNTVLKIHERDESLAIEGERELVWQRCEVGKKFKGGQCIGEAKQMTWPEAMLYANQLNANDIKKSGVSEQWRLPNIIELRGLYHCEGDDWNQNFGKESDTIHTQCMKSIYDDDPSTDDELNLDATIFPNADGTNWTIDPNLRPHGSGGMSIEFYKSSDDELNAGMIEQYLSHEASVRLVRSVIWDDDF